MGADRSRRAVFVVFVVVFVDLLGFGILIPVIPLYALSFGASEFVGSLLIASYSLMIPLFLLIRSVDLEAVPGAVPGDD